MNRLLYKQETYNAINRCFEVHNHLGFGFLEVVYKDALEYEFSKNNIPFEREKRYDVHYKGILLPHYFIADFVIFGKIILEVKAVNFIHDVFIAQAINYLKVSQNRLALVVNFGESSVKYKRIIV